MKSQRTYIEIISERLIGMGSGVILGGFLVLYVADVEIMATSADTITLIVGIALIITGVALELVIRTRNGKK